MKCPIGKNEYALMVMNMLKLPDSLYRVWWILGAGYSELWSGEV